MYALLIQHASQEQIDDLDRTLNAPFGADGYDPAAEREVLDTINIMFAGGPAPQDE